MKNICLIFFLILFVARIHGQDTSYYENGRIKEISFRNIEGQLQGIFILMSEVRDNKILVQGNFINGKKNGAWTFFNYEFNCRDSVVNYKDDVLDGELIVYNWDYQSNAEKLRRKGNYKNGKRDGDFGDYDGNNLRELFRYENGNLVWQEIYWNSFASSYAHLEDIHKGPIKNGKRHGKWKTFYPDGDLYSSYQYENDKLEGEEIVYYGSGKIKNRFNYTNDKLEGRAIYYDSTGKIIASAVFHNDNIQDGTIAQFNERNNKEYFINYYKTLLSIKPSTLIKTWF